MFGCFTKPIGCLDIVLFNAFTILIAHSQFGLGVRISLFRRFTEPFERFLLVGHPEPKVLLKGKHGAKTAPRAHPSRRRATCSARVRGSPDLHGSGKSNIPHERNPVPLISDTSRRIFLYREEEARPTHKSCQANIALPGRPIRLWKKGLASHAVATQANAGSPPNERPWKEMLFLRAGRKQQIAKGAAMGPSCEIS